MGVTIKKRFFRESRKTESTSIMSTLSYTWNVRGTVNGDFMSASGTTASVDGVAEVHGTVGEGAPLAHSTMSDSTVPLARRSSSLALVSRPAALCSGTATKKRVTG